MRARIVTLLAALAGAGALVIGPGAPVSAAACPNEALRTGLSAALPDCRAWELVSPAVKAHSVTANTGRFRVSEGGSSSLPTAAVFQSLGGFSDPEGSGVAIDYMAQRTLAPNTQGWETHPLTPLQDPLSFAAILNAYDPYYVGEGTPDLTKMLFQTGTEVAPAPNLTSYSKLYLRTDLRVPGRGTYELLNDPGFPLPPVSPPARPALSFVAGTSTDQHRVLIESLAKLTSDAPASTAVPKVYKSVNGVLQLVSVLPADEGGGPAPSAIAGQGAGTLIGQALSPNVISDDGTRAFFTVPTDQSEGRLYMRDDQGTPAVDDDVTVRIDKSERVPALPGAQPPATYWNAAADGSRVYFTTHAALTDDAPISNVEKLYVYDTTKPASDPHNLTYISKDEEPADGIGVVRGAIAASADGSTVYFLQTGQSVAGQPVLNGELGIYGWREGRGVQFVGRLQDDLEDPGALLAGRSHKPDEEWGASVTPDGRHLLVSLSQEPWPGTYDQGDCGGGGKPIDGKVGCNQLYLYDFETGEPPVCLSCLSGEPSTQPAYFFARVGAGGSIPDSLHQNRPVSPDGRYVYFTTAEGLLATDLNGAPDVYRYDVSAKALALITAGDHPDGAYFLEASADGRDVFVATRVQLSPWDIDHQMDVYDARVGGGVPPPALAPPECAGESCRAPASAPPPPASIGTSVFAAAPSGRKTGALRRCGKRQRKVRRNGVARCVKKAKKRGHHKHRRRGGKGRASR